MNDFPVENRMQGSPGVVMGPYVMSWVAYARKALLTLVMLAIGTVILQMSTLAGSVWIVGWLAMCVYGFMELRSVRLYGDSDGVWVARGILPWTKGLHGVKWRDLDEAVYFQSFFSWLSKSFRMRIGHRFTKSSEIYLDHVLRGDLAVQEINRIHIDTMRQAEAPDLRR